MTKGKRHTYPEMAAAGLWTTSEDLAKFALNIQLTLKGESETVLSREMTELMLTPFVAEFSGLGIFLDKRKEEIYFGYGGWDEGFSSEMVAHKDKGYGVVILTNSNHPDFISELIRSVAVSYKWDEYVPVYDKLESDSKKWEQFTGRYKDINNVPTLVYNEGNRLYRKRLGRDPVELIQISDATYISRQSERPIGFNNNAETGQFEMVDLDPDDSSTLTTQQRMEEDEVLPLELLESGDFDRALQIFQAFVKANPEDASIKERHLNGLGYQILNSGDLKMAKDLFKVNIILYSTSSNVYDSYAEACMKNGDNEEAIANYEKSLSLDPKNDNARQMIEKINAQIL